MSLSLIKNVFDNQLKECEEFHEHRQTLNYSDSSESSKSKKLALFYQPSHACRVASSFLGSTCYIDSVYNLRRISVLNRSLRGLNVCSLFLLIEQELAT